MPSGHGHTPKETFCIENVLPVEVASEEIDDKGKIAFRELYSRINKRCSHNPPAFIWRPIFHSGVIFRQQPN